MTLNYFRSEFIVVELLSGKLIHVHSIENNCWNTKNPFDLLITVSFLTLWQVCCLAPKPTQLLSQIDCINVSPRIILRPGGDHWKKPLKRHGDILAHLDSVRWCTEQSAIYDLIKCIYWCIFHGSLNVKNYIK